jgi:hypothetical protein
LFHCNKEYTQILNSIEIKEPEELYKVTESKENIETFKLLCKRIAIERNKLNETILNNAKKTRLNKRFQNESKKNSNKSINLSKWDHTYCKIPIVYKNNKIDLNNWDHDYCKPILNKEKEKDKIDLIKKGKEKTVRDRKVKKVDNLTKKRTEKVLRVVNDSITRDSWLTNEHIENFSTELKLMKGKNNYLIMPSEYFIIDTQTLPYIRNNITNEIKTILIIIHKSNHWMLGLINIKEKCIGILDSNGSGKEYTEIYKKLYRILDYVTNNRGNRLDKERVSFISSHNNPKQQNTNDCGVFVCKYIDNIFENNTDQFTISTGDYRDKIKEIIGNNTRTISNENKTITKRIPKNFETTNYKTDHLTIKVAELDYKIFIKKFTHSS